MNILAFLDDQENIALLEALSVQRGYHLNVIRSLEDPAGFFMGAPIITDSTPWFASAYDVVVAESFFLKQLQQMNKQEFNHSFYLYPILLIIDSIDEKSIGFAKESEVFAVIEKKAPKKEYVLRLELLVSSFGYISQMRDWAFRDMLTGLNNRRTFEDFLTVYHKTFQQYHIPFCLAIIDLDHFKTINDTYGHPKGDEVLRNLAEIMSKNTRKTDVLARIGGEEFAIIFPDTTLPYALKVLRRITKTIASYKDKDGVGATLSAGLLESDLRHDTQDKVFLDADKLLYHAKDQGRNRICTHFNAGEHIS